MTGLRVSARWVLPVAGEPIAHGAVLVGAGGRIERVGPDAAVPRPEAAVTVDLGDAALLPGLVNAHSHLELTALRGLVRDRPFVDWLRTIRAIKDGLDAAAFRAAARWGVLEAFGAGITTLGDCGTTLQAGPAMAELGARGVAFHEVIGPDPARCAETLEAAERALEALAPCASERVAVGVSPHAPYTVSDPLLRAVAALASARGLRAAMHVSESREERAFVAEGRGPFADNLRSRGIAVAPRGRTTVAWLEEAGFLAGGPLLIHCVTAGADDFERAARHGATVAHCPWSNAVLGHGRADWGAMRRAGLKVGLGTDSVAAGGRLDLFAEARLAVLGLEAAPAPREMLRLVTADGAAALRLEGVGTLVPGAWGDLAAVGLGTPAMAEAADPETAVAWGATAADVTFAAVAGRTVFERGRWPGVALEREREGFARASAAAAAVSRAAAGSGKFGGPRR
ncbi:MAG TPA: amidohydrolase family protein [Gemmatimonadales bacterium]|nr:amidohydrolase family protein [Gemmatimonadales bacterium]